MIRSMQVRCAVLCSALCCAMCAALTGRLTCLWLHPAAAPPTAPTPVLSPAARLPAFLQTARSR
jgi:hypothetical protein